MEEKGGGGEKEFWEAKEEDEDDEEEEEEEEEEDEDDEEEEDEEEEAGVERRREVEEEEEEFEEADEELPLDDDEDEDDRELRRREVYRSGLGEASGSSSWCSRIEALDSAFFLLGTSPTTEEDFLRSDLFPPTPPPSDIRFPFLPFAPSPSTSFEETINSKSAKGKLTE